MKPFFDNPQRVEKLQAVAAAWAGTPFMPNAAIKGAGVSCQKLVGAIYIETGFLPAGFRVPEGPMNWNHAHTDSLLVEFMAEQPQFETIAAGFEQVQAGDMVGFKLGGCIHHCGLVLAATGRFIQCLRGPGVTFNSLRDATYLQRLEKIWRPVEAQILEVKI